MKNNPILMEYLQIARGMNHKDPWRTTQRNMTLHFAVNQVIQILEDEIQIAEPLQMAMAQIQFCHFRAWPRPAFGAIDCIQHSAPKFYSLRERLRHDLLRVVRQVGA